MCIRDRYEAENFEVEDYVRNLAIYDGVFEIYNITNAIRIYTQSPISISLEHDDPIVRLFAVLDLSLIHIEMCIRDSL